MCTAETPDWLRVHLGIDLESPVHRGHAAEPIQNWRYPLQWSWADVQRGLQRRVTRLRWHRHQC